jgi:16S rRNA (guanine966-N2)-methyltransferase
MQHRLPRELRIIAGEWRGRKLRFPDRPGIRPTPDRVRETLFNWIGARVRGVRALDLFAGSGALGLESLSRGALAATFVDSDARAVQALRERLAEWDARGATVERADARAWLAARRGATSPPFDLVFLDPPFAAGLLAGVAQDLEAGDWLAPAALVYLEAPSDGELPALPPGWELLRSGKAGAVGYHLLRRGGRLVVTESPTT